MDASENFPFDFEALMCILWNMTQQRKGMKLSCATPNFPLRQVREALGMNQGAFAKLIGVSAAYVQAVENGQRPASVELAEKVRDQTGAWPMCIVENWATAVDVEGKPYSREFFISLTARSPKWSDAQSPKWSDPENLLVIFSEPFAVILRGASCAGKAALARSLVRDKLHEAALRIIALDGVLDAIINERSVAGRLTVGQLRKNPDLAKLVGFHDDGTRSDNEEILLQHQPPKCFEVEDLLRKLRPSLDSLEDAWGTLRPKTTDNCPSTTNCSATKSLVPKAGKSED